MDYHALFKSYCEYIDGPFGGGVEEMLAGIKAYCAENKMLIADAIAQLGRDYDYSLNRSRK